MQTTEQKKEMLEAYSEEVIDAQDNIRQLTTLIGNFATDEDAVQWGDVGDMKKVNADLRDLVTFLGGKPNG